MSSKDVGGVDILRDVHCEMMDLYAVELQLTRSQVCYCKQPLRRGRDYYNWRCMSCFAAQNGRVHFRCLNEDCLYNHGDMTWFFIICRRCYEWTDKSNIDAAIDLNAKEDGTETSHIFNRVNRNINAISSTLFFVDSLLFSFFLNSH